MPRSHLVLLGGFTSTHQISQCLGTFIRNPYRRNQYRRQIAGPVATRQFLSIAPIGFDPITCLDGTSVGATTSH